MPPTIIVTVGRLVLEPPELAALDAPPLAAAADELLLPDEQAATVRAVAHAAARAPSAPRRRPVLFIGATPLTRYERKGDRREEETRGTGEGRGDREGDRDGKAKGDGRAGAQTAVASVFVCGRQASSRRSSRLISHSATSAIAPMMI